MFAPRLFSRPRRSFVALRMASSARTQTVTGFNAYMNAVRMKDAPRAQKLEAIVDTFDPNCVIETSTGGTLNGREAARKFYGDVLESSKDTFFP